MIRITQLKLPVKHTEDDIKNAAAGALRLPPSKIRDLSIVKKSLDARKNEIKYI
jgi:uncharacterized FAD-dependent dehydrogenase